MDKTCQTTRRQFTKALGASALAFPFIGWKTASGAPSQNFRFACFGASGRAAGNISSMLGVENVTLVAVAEIDTARSAKTAQDHPDSRIYQDWRKLLEKEAAHIDAVIVATPDHMHAPIAMSAMQLGKHVYCEKPLTRTILECRRLREFAAKNQLITQMGIQVGSGVGNKTAVQWLRAGIVGKVKEVHSRAPKSWGSMQPLPSRIDPVPTTLDWDGWIGVGKSRDYIQGEFHPGNWRKRIGFGTGTLGDMGCHIYHPWFQGLNQPVTLQVTSHGPGPVDGDSWPLDGKVVYRMKGNELTDGDFEFTWYDGNSEMGEATVVSTGGTFQDQKGKTVSNVPGTGSVVIGTTGTMVIPHSNALPIIYRDGKVDPQLPEPAVGGSHHGDWAAAIRGKTSEKPLANWDYAGPMSEVVLIGTVAQRLSGVTLEWDDASLKFTNSSLANAMVHDAYREGWEVKGF